MLRYVVSILVPQTECKGFTCATPGLSVAHLAMTAFVDTRPINLRMCFTLLQRLHMAFPSTYGSPSFSTRTIPSRGFVAALAEGPSPASASLSVLSPLDDWCDEAAGAAGAEDDDDDEDDPSVLVERVLVARRGAATPLSVPLAASTAHGVLCGTAALSAISLRPAILFSTAARMSGLVVGRQ